MKYFFSLLTVLLLFSGCSLLAKLGISEPAKNPDPNHAHADFAVYINNKKLDFSDPKYMESPPRDEAPADSTKEEKTSLLFSSALAHEEEEDSADTPAARKYIHLHDGNGHVIHRHKPELTIGDFFASIGFPMTSECFTLDTDEKYCNESGKRWQMFVNGTEHTYDPDYIFADLDHILLTYAATAAQLQAELAAMTDDACLYSKTCPERGTPPTENCIADAEIPCVLEE